MSWKDILKNLEMDNTSGCCEQARMSLVEWFEEHNDKVDSMDEGPHPSLKDYFERSSLEFSEYPCDELYEAAIEFIEGMSGSESIGVTFYDMESFQKIVDDWDKCKEEPIAEKESQYDSLKVFADNQTAWMDKYIGGAKQ